MITASDLIAPSGVENNLLDRIAELERVVTLLQSASLGDGQVRTLEELTDNMGLLQAGEFRSGNGVEPDSGFSGVRIGYPAFSYGGVDYNIVGVNNDALMFALRASDGAALFAGGNARLDADAMTLTGLLYAIQHTAVNSGNTRLARLGMFLPAGSAIPAAQWLFTSAAGSELCLNPGFETGDFTSWTEVDASNCLAVVITTTQTAHTGNYSAFFSASSVSDTATLTTARMAVTAGNYYGASAYLYLAGRYSYLNMPRIIAKIKWYDHASAGSLLRTDTWADDNSSQSYTLRSGSYIAPTGALSAAIVFEFSVVDNGDSPTSSIKANVDDVSFSEQAISRQLYFGPNLTYEGGPYEHAQLSAQPSAPASGFRQLYSKSTGWYEQDSAGVESMPGHMRLISEVTASSSASIAFTNLSSAYRYYILVLRNLKPATDATSLVLTFSEDNGATYLSTNYKYHIQQHRSNLATYVAGNSNSAANILTSTQGNAAAEAAHGQIHLWNMPSALNNKHVTFALTLDRADDILGTAFGAGMHLGATAVNAVKLAFASGNIASGTVALYGVI